jgi:hypothetical protein
MRFVQAMALFHQAQGLAAAAPLWAFVNNSPTLIAAFRTIFSLSSEEFGALMCLPLTRHSRFRARETDRGFLDRLLSYFAARRHFVAYLCLGRALERAGHQRILHNNIIKHDLAELLDRVPSLRLHAMGGPAFARFPTQLVRAGHLPLNAATAALVYSIEESDLRLGIEKNLLLRIISNAMKLGLRSGVEHINTAIMLFHRFLLEPTTRRLPWRCRLVQQLDEAPDVVTSPAALKQLFSVLRRLNDGVHSRYEMLLSRWLLRLYSHQTDALIMAMILALLSRMNTGMGHVIYCQPVALSTASVQFLAHAAPKYTQLVRDFLSFVGAPSLKCQSPCLLSTYQSSSGC